MKRRTFMKVSSGVTAGLCLGCLSGCDSKPQEETNPETPESQTAQEQPVSDALEVKLADYPALSNSDGWVRIEKPELPAMLIIHAGQGQYAAVSSKCTHRNAPLQYDPTGKKIFCGLHHSEFDLTGQVQKGPAAKPLVQYTVMQKGEVLQISEQIA